MKLVDPGAGLDAVEPPRRLGGDRAEDVDANREVRGRQHADASAFHDLAACGLIRLPSGGADDKVPPSRCNTLDVRAHTRGVRKVDDDVHLAEVQKLEIGRAVRTDNAGDLAVVGRGMLLHEPAHPAMSDEDQPHAGTSPKKRSWTSASARSRSVSAMTSVMFRLAAACDSIRTGTPLNASSRCPTNVGASFRSSPTPQMIAIPSSRVTSATSASAFMMSGSRRVSSIVTETLTSDVVTTSTDVRNCSNTSKIRRRNPCAMSMRVDWMSTTVTPRFDATAVSGLPVRGRSRVTSVPRESSGRRELRMRTGMLRATAG